MGLYVLSLLTICTTAPGTTGSAHIYTDTILLVLVRVGVLVPGLDKNNDVIKIARTCWYVASKSYEVSTQVDALFPIK